MKRNKKAKFCLNHSTGKLHSQHRDSHKYKFCNFEEHFLGKKLKSAFPPLSIPCFNYASVQKINGDTFPCVEIWLLNFIIYFIWGDNDLDNKIKNEINPNLLPVNMIPELKSFFTQYNKINDIIKISTENFIARTDNKFQKYYD